MKPWPRKAQPWPTALLILSALVAGAASTAAASHSGITPAEERRAGRRVAAEIEAQVGRMEDPKRLRRVLAVGRRLETAALLPPSSIDFRLLNTPEFNALALPGGIIFVARGLVDKVRSDDELAAALAHEVAHIALGHTRQLLEEQRSERRVVFVVGSPPQQGAATPRESAAGGAPAASGIREKELEADRAALPLLQRAGYRPEAFLGMLAHLRQPEPGRPDTQGEALDAEASDSLSTHPTVAERAQRVKAQLRAMEPLTQGRRAGR